MSGVGKIDWQAIHRRIERAAIAAERWGERGPEEVEKILKARARALAGEEKEDAGDQVEVIEFLLAYERYALELDGIREGYPMKDITPLPGTPPFVAGIINVRGRIVSVVDLKRFFDLPSRGLPDLNRVIVIGNDEMEFGLLADFVTGVRHISRAGIQPAPPTLSGIRADYLKGVTADLLAILDAGRLLADPRLRVSQSD
jgi:purine-binding chemotaxis protein CheW